MARIISTSRELIRGQIVGIYKNHTKAPEMKNVMKPIRATLRARAATYMEQLRDFRTENGFNFEDYCSAITAFYLGQAGDVLNDIAHICAKGLHGEHFFYFTNGQGRPNIAEKNFSQKIR
jgi:hypothetical protein